jgi:hypothetical protein
MGNGYGGREPTVMGVGEEGGGSGDQVGWMLGRRDLAVVEDGPAVTEVGDEG